jgi:hypothetical protein
MRFMQVFLLDAWNGAMFTSTVQARDQYRNNLTSPSGLVFFVSLQSASVQISASIEDGLQGRVFATYLTTTAGTYTLLVHTIDFAFTSRHSVRGCAQTVTDPGP